MNAIINDIENDNLQRFYQILNHNGIELNISDSETESDDDEDDDDDIDGDEGDNDTAGDDIVDNLFDGGDMDNKNDIKKQVKLTNSKKNVQQHSCNLCNEVFNRSFKITQHMKYEHPDSCMVFTCYVCQRYYATEYLLVKHIKNQCNNKLKNFSCDLCKVKFMWESSLTKHKEKFHLQQSTNRKASSSSSSSGGGVGGGTGNITVSSRGHSSYSRDKPKEKNFTCSTCQKSFYRQEHLDRHIKIHSPSERKFECTICQKKFNRKDNLR